MLPFSYTRVETLRDAISIGRETGSGQTDAPAQFLAGGTTLIDLMKLDVLTPRALIDIAPLSGKFSEIKSTSAGLSLGAFATMAAVGDDVSVNRDYPMIAQSLNLAASAQLRNMATLGGNVLQRTRCPYYRDPSWSACNKRVAGSGCSAIGGVNRNHAVLGGSDLCISQYPGDFAVALVALGATIEIAGPAA